MASRPNSAAAAAACARLNHIHGHYPISDGDYVYTLSVFVLDAVDAINTYGWRRVHPQEAAGVLLAWRRLGQSMGMGAQGTTHLQDATKSWTSLRAWRTAYETQRMKVTPEAFRLTEDSVTLFRFHPAVSPLLTAASALSYPLRCLGGALGCGAPMHSCSWEGERMYWFRLFDRAILRPLILVATTPRLQTALGLKRPTSTAQLGRELRERCLQQTLHGRQIRGAALGALRAVSPHMAVDSLFNARRNTEHTHARSAVGCAAEEAHLPIPPWAHSQEAQRGMLHFDTQVDCAVAAAEAACDVQSLVDEESPSAQNTCTKSTNARHTGKAVRRRRGSSMDSMGWGGVSSSGGAPRSPLLSPGASHCATAGWGGEEAEFVLEPEHCDALGLPSAVTPSPVLQWLLPLLLLAVAAVQRFVCFPRCGGGCSAMRSPPSGVRPGCPMVSPEAVQAAADCVFMERFALYGVPACPRTIASIGPAHMKPLGAGRSSGASRARSVARRPAAK